MASSSSSPAIPRARTYGPFPAADGNPAAYLFAWDEAAQDYLPVEEG